MEVQYLFKEWQKVPEEGEEGKEEANVPEAGVGLEDSDQAHQGRRQQQRGPPEPGVQ